MASGITASDIPMIPNMEVDKIRTKSIEAEVSEFMRTATGTMQSRDFIYNTIFIREIEAMVSGLQSKLMSSRTDAVEINLCNIFHVKVSMKHNSDAEKEGNINVLFFMDPECPKTLDELLSQLTQLKDKKGSLLIPSDRGLEGELHQIELAAKNNLSGKNSIIIADDWFITTITAAFMIATRNYCFQECIDRNVRGMHFNLMDMIEIFVKKNKDGTYQFNMSPGEGSKLSIKYDGRTELDG